MLTIAVSFLVLAQRGYFKEKEFINYLDYLQYWKKQQYAVYLKSVNSCELFYNASLVLYQSR